MGILLRVAETRRRGAALEQAILDAAWAELAAVGYAELTMAGVAARAGTAKSVLYRRWVDKTELIRALIDQRVPRLGRPVPSGDLRSDVLAVLDALVAGYRGLQVVSDLDPELSARLRRNTAEEAAAQLVDVLAAAGFDPTMIRPRVLRLPIDLVVHDLFNGAGSADPGEIVDEIFLPLLRLSQNGAPSVPRFQ